MALEQRSFLQLLIRSVKVPTWLEALGKVVSLAWRHFWIQSIDEKKRNFCQEQRGCKYVFYHHWEFKCSHFFKLTCNAIHCSSSSAPFNIIMVLYCNTDKTFQYIHWWVEHEKSVPGQPHVHCEHQLKASLLPQLRRISRNLANCKVCSIYACVGLRQMWFGTTLPSESLK
jgi:hypothetical protein